MEISAGIAKDVSGVRAIILNYLLEIGDNGTFKSHDVELELPQWGYQNYKKLHNPATYSRIFRKLRNENTLKHYGIELTEIDSRKEKSWKVKLSNS